MKIRNRIFAGIITIALIISILPSAFALHFSDVTPSIGTDYLDAINYITDNGILVGTTSTTFDPDVELTRGMFVAMLYRMEGVQEIYTDADVFTDVSPQMYYYKAIGWAAANNIVYGTAPTLFSPDDPVNRMQAVTFLCRYARYKGEDINSDFDITMAADYNSVENYAKLPFAWAITNGIIDFPTSTSALCPNVNIDRKESALFFKLYINNVEGIRKDKDAYCFVNSRNSFLSDSTIMLSSADWSRVTALAHEQGVTAEDIQSSAAQRWGGSCFGMSVTTVLDFTGIIDLNGNCCNDAKTMYDIPNLSALDNEKHILTTDWQTGASMTEAESKINLYQYSWMVPEIRQYFEYTHEDNRYQDMVDSLEYGGAGVFSFEGIYSDGCPYYHAIVAYGKPEAITNGYKIKTYDCSYPSQTTWIEINTTGQVWSAEVVASNGYAEVYRNEVGVCKFQDDLSYYRFLDFDDYDNTTPTTLSDDYVTLKITVTGYFSIENDHEEYFEIGRDGAQGDMEIGGIDFFPGGEGFPCTYFLLMNPDEEITCYDEDGVIVAETSEVNGVPTFVVNCSQSDSVLDVCLLGN